MAKDFILDKGVEPKKETSLNKESVLHDFEICCISRAVSVLGRREVLSGRGKFGIFGAGKEVPQVAMAKAFKKGDFRSGYYRDQTFLLAKGLATVEGIFAQLFADTENDPFSGGRQMNNHFATRLIDENGKWTNHLDTYNISADISSTAGQMSRALGIAHASKKYKRNKTLRNSTTFSKAGKEISFCTIGDASTSEGVFWETCNAAGVMQVPLLISVWDDGYGISVPVEFQTTKGSISEAIKGLAYDEKTKQGLKIYTAKAWDYQGLIELYQEIATDVRETHRPALLHVKDVTQPMGHSTSGSHERYKSNARLEWEEEKDCIVLMEKWMLKEGIADADLVIEIKAKAKVLVQEGIKKAWKALNQPFKEKRISLQKIYDTLPFSNEETAAIKLELSRMSNPDIRELLVNARQMHYAMLGERSAEQNDLLEWIAIVEQKGHEDYHTHLYSDSERSALKVPVITPQISEKSSLVNGYQILRSFFDYAFNKYPEVYAFGEDVGQIGDVNQGLAGLQEKYGISRIFDAGIRENTIVGQAIGMALRGLRPIAEMQYLDYLVYGLQPLTDDLSTLRYRSKGMQHAPAIIRTRGHRLEGIWHSGSPLGMMINSLRGMYILTPRSMVQAAGFYNTLLQSDDPAIVIECLNGYRIKERMPDNMGEYTVPIGIPEILQEGKDITLITYGSCVRIAQKGIEMLEKRGISVELIDVQTLLPFDTEHSIVQSLKKTNRIVFMDEDVPGGATAFMMREVLEVQGGYSFLDAAPYCLSAADHRPPYGDAGDYFTKPNAENVFEVIYKIMMESEPDKFVW